MAENINLDELLNQALGLIKIKNFDKAMQVYEDILKIDKKQPQALSHLSIIYLMNKRYQEAIDMTHRSFEVVSPIVGDYQNLATAYNALKEYEHAIVAYKKIIKIDPNITETYKLLGDAQINIVDYDGAIESYKQAYELEPEKFQSIYDYGVILAICLHHEEALRQLRKALKIDPNHIECLNQIAACLTSICDYEGAKTIYQKLKLLVPDALGPYIDYASCLIYEGKYDEPVKILKKVLAVKSNPKSSPIKHSYKITAKSNLSMLYLVNKKFREGWENYDARILRKNEIDITKRYDMLKKNFDIDLETKELKKDEKIIILLDAGIGDVILGLSMLKEFNKLFPNVSAEVDFRIVDLCKRSFPGIRFFPVRENKHEFIIDYDLSLFDKGIYWGSIGKYVREKIEDFPKKYKDFLIPDKKKTFEIKNKIKKNNNIICGISWKSSAQEGRHKSALLKDLLPILSIKNISFLDLQYETIRNKGQTALEKEKLLNDKNITITEYKKIDKFEDIDGVTALISNCDIVVTSSNVTAHIAGALGIKTFLFVPNQRGKLWYWHDKDSMSIWYPSIKIFTANSSDGWGGLFEEISEKINLELNSGP